MWEAKCSFLLSAFNKEGNIHGICVNYQQPSAQRWHQRQKQKHSENRFLDKDIDIVLSHHTGK